MTTSDEPSGLTVDGIAIPISIESEGPDAIEAYLAALAGHISPVIATAPNPPTYSEGDES